MPDKFTVSNLSAASSEAAASSPPTAPDTLEPKLLALQVGTQEVPLPSLIIIVAALLISFIIWNSIMAFSASLLRLAVGLIVAGAFILLSPLRNQLQGSAGGSPRVDDG